MRMTILGEYGPYAPAGGACSGYLLSHGGSHVLLDCGPGALARMQQIIGFQDLCGVALSHLHGDHAADMAVLRYALAILGKRGVPVRAPLPVLCPAEPPAEAGFLAAQPEYAVAYVEDGMRADVGPFEFKFTRMDHPVPSYAMSVTAGGRRFAYSGDTRMNPRLAPFAEGADLFLCEAGCLERDLNGRTPHLSVREAARLGKDARCRRTILTHLSPVYSREEMSEEAARTDPRAALARALDSYEL